MKNKILQLLLSIIIFFAAGCQEEKFGNKRIPLAAVSLSLAETRVDSDHPTMVSPEYREDFVLAISMGEQKEIYINKDGKWVPDGKPVYFPDEKTPQDIYFECYYLYSHTDENQDTFDKIQQKDTLVGVELQKTPVNGLTNVILKHKNSIIEVRLSDELTDKGDVYINNTIPYKYSSNIYHLIVNKAQKASSVPFLMENNEGERYGCDLYLPTSELLENSLYTFLLKLGYSDILEVEPAITLSEWSIQEEGEMIINPQMVAFMSLKIEGLDTKNKIILNREDLRKERITYNEEFQSYRIRYFKDEQTGHEPTLSSFTIENDAFKGRVYELGIKYEEKSEIRLKLTEDGDITKRGINILGRTYYAISSIEELKYVVSDYPTADFYQERDLYFDYSSAFREKNSQHYIVEEFRGSYNGNSKTMYNISIDDISPQYEFLSKYWGLFKLCFGAKITNLAIENLTVKLDNTGGIKYIGGLVGYSSFQSEIQSCTMKNCKILIQKGGGVVGGMIGCVEMNTLLNQLSIENFEISIDNSMEEEESMKSVGGIVGYCRIPSAIHNCTVKNSSITAKGNLYTGGITGHCSSITNSTITRSTIQADKNFVGGIAAYVTDDNGSKGNIDAVSSVNNCRSEDTNLNILATNKAEIADTIYAGGIIGRYTPFIHAGVIASCLAIRNTITSEKKSVCGGIVGSVIHQKAITIRECEGLNGTVSSTFISGGICGECYAENPAILDDDQFPLLTKCTNSSQIRGNQYAGGICARNEGGQVTLCRNSGEVGGSSAVKYSGGICGFMTVYNNPPVGGYTSPEIIRDCTNSGIIKGDIAGGIFGSCQLGNEFKKRYLKHVISECTNTLEAKIQGGQYAGGICGVVDYIGVDIEKSRNSGYVVAENCAGGICAKNERNSIHLCTNSGKIETTANNATGSGGICGLITLYDSDRQFSMPMEMMECTNLGAIEGCVAGGICGLFEGISNKNQLEQKDVTVSMNRIANHGLIDSKKFNGGTSGGIISKTSLKNGNIYISKGYSVGEVTGANDNTTVVGSIIGLIEIIKSTTGGGKVQIDQCYAGISTEYINTLSKGKKDNWGYFFGRITQELYHPLSHLTETSININDLFYMIKGGESNGSNGGGTDYLFLDNNKLIGFYHTGLKYFSTSDSYISETTSLNTEAQRVSPFTAPHYFK